MKNKVLIFVFFTLLFLGIYYLYTLFFTSYSNWKKLNTNAAIVSMIDGPKGNAKYQKMLLSDSQMLSIPKTMYYKLKVGDSVFKQKDSLFYIFTLIATSQKIRTPQL